MADSTRQQALDGGRPAGQLTLDGDLAEVEETDQRQSQTEVAHGS